MESLQIHLNLSELIMDGGHILQSNLWHYLACFWMIRNQTENNNMHMHIIETTKSLFSTRPIQTNIEWQELQTKPLA